MGNPLEIHVAFYVALVSLLVSMREHELWHPQQLQEIWFQALLQLDGSSKLQQEAQALQAQQTEHDSLQDLTGFCKYLLCRIRRYISFFKCINPQGNLLRPCRFYFFDRSVE